MLYHFIEERNFADKAEFNIKWNNALPNGGWLSKDATLESETLRYERKWNYFMVLMAALTFTCPLVILILGKIVLRINLFELDDTLQQNFAQGMKLTTGKEMTIAKAFDIAWKIAILSARKIGARTSILTTTGSIKAILLPHRIWTSANRG